MLWGQQIKVYTDHKNLIRDALGLTSDRVYQWRLLVEEYAPEIVYIKGIHTTGFHPVLITVRHFHVGLVLSRVLPIFYVLFALAGLLFLQNPFSPFFL
jgi:hypothetical protein